MLEKVVSYELHSGEVFNSGLKEIYDVLSDNQQNIKFGPKFHVETETKPENLFVQSIFVENIKKTETNFDDHNKSLILIATDLNNQLAGYRITHFNQTEFNCFYCNGEINVLKNGLGYATQIELCHMHILQKEANDLRAFIKYYLEDGNKNILSEFEKLYLEGKLNVNELNKKINERKRWENLYGQGGLLDFIGGNKEFSPDNQIYTKYDYGTTSDVFLERKDSLKSNEKRSIGLFKKCDSEYNRDKLKQNQLLFLNNSLLPQMR